MLRFRMKYNMSGICLEESSVGGVWGFWREGGVFVRGYFVIIGFRCRVVGECSWICFGVFWILFCVL